MSKPNTITELRDDMLDIYEQLKRDPKRMLQTRELANAAGKVIATVKLELEYAALRQERPVIDFLGGEHPAGIKQLRQ